MDLNGAIRYLNKKHLVFQGDGCACQPDASQHGWLGAGPCRPSSGDLASQNHLLSLARGMGRWGSKDRGPGRGNTEAEAGECVTPHRARRPPDSQNSLPSRGSTLLPKRGENGWGGEHSLICFISQCI